MGEIGLIEVKEEILADDSFGGRRDSGSACTRHYFACKPHVFAGFR